jgi:P-type conjugative transfer protein TrbJ
MPNTDARSPGLAKAYRKALKLMGAGLVLTPLFWAEPASAQVVYCTNCSSELTQLQNYLQLVSTLAKQAALLEQAITQTGIMAQNAAPLASPTYGSGQTDLAALQRLVSQTTALSYASSNLDQSANTRFQTYQAYAASPPDGSGFAAKYQQWSQDMEASVLTTLKAAQAQSTQITWSEQQTIASLKAQTSGAIGQMQVQQTGNAINLEAIAQVQKLRQLLLLDLQLKANAAGSLADREAAQQAAWTAFVTKPSITLGQGGAQF